GDRLDTAALADSQLIELLARDAAELAHVVAAEEGIAGVRQLIAAVERDAGRGDGARAGAVDRRDIASVAAGAGDGRPAVVAAPPDDVDLIGAGRPVLGRQEVAGDRIEGQAERVNAQDLAAQAAEVLRGVLRLRIAQGDVELALWPKRQAAAVVAAAGTD